MFTESPEILSKLLNWVSIPITGMVGILGFHYKKLNSHVDELSEEVSDLKINSAVSQNDIKYIKQSCDLIHSKLEKIEEKLPK